MNSTLELKKALEKKAKLEEKKKKLEAEIKAIEEESEEYAESKLQSTNSDCYSDDNVIITKTIKLTKAIDSVKALSNDTIKTAIFDAVSAGKFSLTLNASKTSKLIKDKGLVAEDYIVTSSKETFEFKINGTEDFEKEEF